MEGYFLAVGHTANVGMSPRQSDNNFRFSMPSRRNRTLSPPPSAHEWIDTRRMSFFIAATPPFDMNYDSMRYGDVF